MFDAAYKTQEHFRIEPYNPDYHINNFYYFRLGGLREAGEAIPLTESLEVKPRAFLRIWSLERFELSDRVVAFFGNVSALVDKGLELVHSPSIAPGFSGSLALGLRNNLDEAVQLEPHERIGKILFFDCADTFINVEQFVKNVLKQKELDERRKAGEVILRAYSQLTEGLKDE